MPARHFSFIFVYFVICFFILSHIVHGNNKNAFRAALRASSKKIKFGVIAASFVLPYSVNLNIHDNVMPAITSVHSSSKLHNREMNHNFGCGCTACFSISSASAKEPIGASLSAVDNIERVNYSLKYILDDIESGSNPKQIISQVKTLMRNYKLRENIQLAVPLITDSNSQRLGKQLGTEAYEYLSQIFEYFTDENSFESSSINPREVLVFAQQGIQAAKQDLDKFVDLLPPDVKSSMVARISKEFSN